MDIVALFIPNAKPTKEHQPANGGFHVPAGNAQAASVLGVPASDHRFNPALPQGLTDLFVVVIPPIRLHLLRTSTRAAPWTFDGGNGIDQGNDHVAVVAIGPGVSDGQRDPFAEILSEAVDDGRKSAAYPWC